MHGHLGLIAGAATQDEVFHALLHVERYVQAACLYDVLEHDAALLLVRPGGETLS